MVGPKGLEAKTWLAADVKFLGSGHLAIVGPEGREGTAARPITAC